MHFIYSRAEATYHTKVVLFRALSVALLSLLTIGQRSVQAQTTTATPAQASSLQSANSPMSLADLERLALEANPTLAQAEAAIRAAEGRRVQAGLMPNPVIGYSGNEFAFRAFSDKSEHLGFIEQTIPLGGKLSKSRAIFAQEKNLAEQSAVATQGHSAEARRDREGHDLSWQQIFDGDPAIIWR